MKSIQYKAAQQVACEEKAVPEVGPGEVLIKVAYAGVCGSDMIIYQGVHPRAKAPLVLGRTLTITCAVSAKAKSGVIVSHGGMTVGYALYLKDGKPVFAVHQAGEEVVRIVAPNALAGRAKLEARLGAGGAMLLLVDGQQVAKGRVKGLLSRQPAEALCVGFDDAKTVDDYDGKTRFDGSIDELTVTTAAR